MTRVTRSQKIDIPEDHTVAAIQTPLPDATAKHLAALVEINISKGQNTMHTVDDSAIATELKGLKAAYRNAIGAGKKRKKGKNKKNDNQGIQADSEEVADDDGADMTNQPAEPAHKLLQSGEGSLYSLLDKPNLPGGTQAAEFIPVCTVRPATPPSPARRTTRQQLARIQAAFTKSTNHGKVVDKMGVNVLQGEIEIVSPSSKETSKLKERKVNQASQTPMRTLGEVERAYGLENSPTFAGDTDDDSFLEQITCRSPAKPVSRIEDSVEALDQLEEALEVLDQAALVEQLVSPKKTRQAAYREPQDSRSTLRTKRDAHIGLDTSRKQPDSKSGFSTMRVKPTAQDTEPSIRRSRSMTTKPTTCTGQLFENESHARSPRRTAVTRPVSLLPPKQPVKSTKPPTRPAFELPGEAIARRLKEQREARLAQRESSRESGEASSSTLRVASVPQIRSTKLPTKPNFELPGEAVSRRKKEAHQARLMAQAEEERKRREFKAKPVRKSVLLNSVPRDTAASRARQSKIGLEQAEHGNLDASERGSNIGAHRPSMSQLIAANTSAPRTPGPPAPLVRKSSARVGGHSMSGLAMRRTLSTSEAQVQRQRGKEIYNRDVPLAEDIERERREREAAAKRSREEAAERGRQASREWAEKQRARKMAEGDKGMTPGYGPGGQLGLTS